MSEITDLNVTDASNTALSGTNIQGTAPASNMDNGLRALSGMLARMNAGTAPLADTFTLGDNSDLTKRFRFEASGITAGQTRVVTVPDANITLVPQTSPAFLTSFSVSGSATGTMGTLTSTAASSATAGPVLVLARDATSSNNHLGGSIDFHFKDGSGNALESFAAITAAVVTATHGAEDGAILFNTKRSGTSAGRWTLGAGFYKFGGTDPGAGLIGADGLQFPATVALSANANTLDDYEEGTFTPAFSSSGATFSYATRNGEYRKVGKLVFYSVELALNTTGNTVTANPVTITGLPFTCNTAALTYQAASVLWNASTTSYIWVLAGVGNSNTSITLTGTTAAAQGNAAAVNSNALLHATLGSAVRVTGYYSTDS